MPVLQPLTINRTVLLNAKQFHYVHPRDEPQKSEGT
jgi:hypothetical protein